MANNSKFMATNDQPTHTHTSQINLKAQHWVRTVTIYDYFPCTKTPFLYIYPYLTMSSHF